VPHTIDVTTRAMVDIRATAARLKSRSSPSIAARWHTGILAAARSLAAHPDRLPLADEAAELAIDLRELLYGRRRGVYRILFTIDGSAVHIHRVRHAAQDRLELGDV
jgi:plasmid stabilization system protein ParE